MAIRREHKKQLERKRVILNEVKDLVLVEREHVILNGVKDLVPPM